MVSSGLKAFLTTCSNKRHKSPDTSHVKASKTSSSRRSDGISMSILESIVMGILLHCNVVAQRKTAMVTVRSSDIDGMYIYIYICIWLVFMANVGNYTIHGYWGLG